MPRKSASHAAKKDAVAVESKSEGSAPRRSGRAVTKSEPSPAKEATRSRRGSTVAQTAAASTDTKSPKSRNSVSSRRDSSSPSDNRGRSGREGVESPATRVKSTRRNASRINYKESDGEEEAPTPKNDENFDSNEEFEESDSDEKSKSKGRGKATPKAVGRSRSAKEKSKVIGGRGRRGRPAKKKSIDEESEPETFDVSEDSEADDHEVTKKKSKRPTKASETPSRRGRKARSTPESGTEEKSKPSRRSSRAAVSKDETPIKRPSRSVQAKRYTEEEEDDEDAEEMSDSKATDDDDEKKEKSKPEPEGSRKRKHSSTSEPNKRLKEDEGTEKEVEKKEEDEEEEDCDMKSEGSEQNKESSDVKESAEGESEKAMEVDETDSQDEKEKPVKKTIDDSEKKVDNSITGEKKIESNKEKDTNAPKENSVEQKATDNSDNFYDSASDSEQGSKADRSMSSGVEDSQESKENDEDKGKIEKKMETAQVSFDNLTKNEGFNESKTTPPVEIQENASPIKTSSSIETSQENAKAVASEQNVNSTAPVENKTSSGVPHSKEQNADATFNGAERASPAANATNVIHPPSSVIFENKDSASAKANGEHDGLHNLYHPIPGCKYVFNPKLSESVLESVKDTKFSVASFNMGGICYDYANREELVKSLKNLDCHILCFQQVPRSFYVDVLKNHLSALGYETIFNFPHDKPKGLATFFKTSHFKSLNHQKGPIKDFIEKELEASILDKNDKKAVKMYLDAHKFGDVIYARLNAFSAKYNVTIVNVQIPPSELSIQAIQVSSLARKILSTVQNDTHKSYILCGEFNMTDKEPSYQLLRDGCLNEEMLQELERKKDIALPGQESKSLASLFRKGFQHVPYGLGSSYSAVLDHELIIPEKKTVSPDQLWCTSHSLHTIGVLDFISCEPGESHVSLKADYAFHLSP